jgi:hypothetical protein
MASAFLRFAMAVVAVIALMPTASATSFSERTRYRGHHPQLFKKAHVESQKRQLASNSTISTTDFRFLTNNTQRK